MILLNQLLLIFLHIHASFDTLRYECLGGGSHGGIYLFKCMNTSQQIPCFDDDSTFTYV